jgi:hypothetical protein
MATGEMWNSNSVVSWLLTRAGIAEIHPPRGWRAPGWDAGIRIAHASEDGRVHDRPRLPIDIDA